MTPATQSITTFLAVCTLIADVAGAALLIAILEAQFFKKSHAPLKKILDFTKKRAVPLSLGVALLGTLSSLFYSEIAGFAPCLLCWWQRIFLYPEVILLGIALFLKDQRVANYILPLSGIGALLAAYHSYLQFGGSPLVPCAASGLTVSCEHRYFLEFGYITIPTMALTGFLLITLFMIAQKLTYQTEDR